MGLAPSLVIQLPGYPFETFPSVATIDMLRAISSASFSAEDNYVVDGSVIAGDGGGGVFAWNPSSTAADDGATVLRPSDKSPGQAGRWVLIGKDVIDDALSGITANLASPTGPGLIGFSPNQTYPGNTLGAWLQWAVEGHDIRSYGYVGDGASHPLSAVTRFKGLDATGWTLAQWQAAVPQATALTNQIDRIAVQAWFNDRPKGGSLCLPAGEGVFDAGIETGANQVVDLSGVGRDLTRIRHTGTDWLWRHGWALGPANGIFTVKSLTVIPAAGSGAAGCFRVRFSGSQRPWCHNIADVLIYPEDGTSYYIQPTETWNIKRGLDWENFIVYGRHFFAQATPAHLFPPNVGADCPTGQLQTIAGNSYNFDNCMVIGYYDGWEFDFTGFTSSSAHCHEEGRWYGCEAYSGVGFASIVNTNTNYAPADNWVFEHCGWQGTGRGFDLLNVEYFRCTGMLCVNDTTTANDHVWLANVLSCRDVSFEGNEIFIVEGSSDLTVFYVAGAATAGIEVKDNGTVSYSTIDQWLYIGTDVLAAAVEERGNRFRGTGIYTNGKVADASDKCISETRVADIVGQVPGAFKAWTVEADGAIVYTDKLTGTSDASGNVSYGIPSGLVRSVVDIVPSSANPSINSSCAVASNTLTGMVVRYPGVSTAGTSLTTSVKVIGR